MKAEHIGHRLIELALLPAKQIAARRGFQPASQTYNRAILRHEIDCTATLDNQDIRPGARREAIAIGRPAPVQRAMNAMASVQAGILVTHPRGGHPGHTLQRHTVLDCAAFDAARAATLQPKDKKR